MAGSRRRRFGLAMSIAAGAALLGSLPALAFGVVSVKDASAGPSPFTDCPNIGPAEGGTNYPQTEIEPRIADVDGQVPLEHIEPLIFFGMDMPR